MYHYGMALSTEDINAAPALLPSIGVRVRGRVRVRVMDRVGHRSSYGLPSIPMLNSTIIFEISSYDTNPLRSRVRLSAE